MVHRWCISYMSPCKGVHLINWSYHVSFFKLEHSSLLCLSDKRSARQLFYVMQYTVFIVCKIVNMVQFNGEPKAIITHCYFLLFIFLFPITYIFYISQCYAVWLYLGVTVWHHHHDNCVLLLSSFSVFTGRLQPIFDDAAAYFVRLCSFLSQRMQFIYLSIILLGLVLILHT